MARPVEQRRLGDHRLRHPALGQRHVGVDHGQRRRAHGDGVHRDRADQRHPLLLPGARPQRRRHRPPSNIVNADPAHRAVGAALADGGPGQRRVDPAVVAGAGDERRRGGHRLRHPALGERHVGWTTVNDGVSTATAYTVTGLTNGTRYYFRVLARTPPASGRPSNVANAVPRTVPTAPRSLHRGAETGSGQVRLSWLAPASQRWLGDHRLRHPTLAERHVGLGDDHRRRRTRRPTR